MLKIVMILPCTLHAKSGYIWLDFKVSKFSKSLVTRPQRCASMSHERSQSPTVPIVPVRPPLQDATLFFRISYPGHHLACH